MRFLIIFGLAGLLAACGESMTPEQRAQASCESGTEAILVSRDFVEDRLRAPSTADFPSTNSEGVRSRYLGNCTHEVWAYVDAQNAFGAQIRTKYYAKLKNPDGAGTWYVVELEM
jgi:hypothetical protein|tara:strand:+ start:7300 stop:7644 length:345 start_codon:yes stop_codon:yes gene_type:complete